MTIIEDGGGKNKAAIVTSEQKLQTLADVRSRALVRSIDEFRFAVGTGFLTLPAGFNGPVLRFQNDDNDKNFHIQRFIVGWDGGNTNFNRSVKFSTIKNATAATANVTVITPGNTNLGSSRAATATAEKWSNNSTTAGMTGQSDIGSVFITNILGQGRTAIDVEGGLVLTSGKSLSLIACPDEAGEFTTSIVGFYETDEESK